MIDKDKLLEWINENKQDILGVFFVNTFKLRQAINNGEFDRNVTFIGIFEDEYLTERYIQIAEHIKEVYGKEIEERIREK